MNYITDEIRALIGAETGWVDAFDAVEASEVRRFHHATMDPAPRYWDAAAAGRHGGPVAPPAFPVHAFRRAPDGPDPLASIHDPDADGLSRAFRGLPPVEVPLPRLLNGGYRYEFFRYARTGERIQRKSRYLDIRQKDARSGPMVLIDIEDRFRTVAGEPLLNVVTTTILR
ncbi:MAG: MaoC family dehydratase N-terminal domain-containing protein [Rhodobacteraceae bacterium]|nr:MaoC family dehydratase N-terminal domain-containing protein [Paracoccaceae bacterium]